jgi:hypothetical protein
MKYKKIKPLDIDRIAGSIINAQHEPTYSNILKHLALLEYGETTANCKLVQKFMEEKQLIIDKPSKILAFFRSIRKELDNQTQQEIDDNLDQINELLEDMQNLINGNRKLKNLMNYQVFNISN